MRRSTLFALVTIFFVINSAAQEARVVERKDVDSKVMHEAVISGYLTEVNGKYKLRVTETSFKPGGYVGEHNHVGPGIRVVTAGELTLVEAGRTRVYKQGDVFYESGDVTNSAHNKGNVPAVLLTFEILPVDWKAGSGVPPKSK